MTWDVSVTEQARTDIRGIGLYLHDVSPATARKFAAELGECLRRLSEMPQLGAKLGFKNRALRRVRVSARFSNWLVIYGTGDEETLEIIRVIHGSRNVSQILGGEK